MAHFTLANESNGKPRRKKTRCPGEFPACSFCVRLDQPCQYTESMQGKSRSLSRVLGKDKEDIPYVSSHTSMRPVPCAENLIQSDLIARVAQLEEMVRMPAQPEMAKSQTGPETFQPPDAWAFTASSLANTSPPAAVDSTGSLAELVSSLVDLNVSLLTFHSSENMFPLSTCLIQLAIDAFFLHSHNQPYSFFCESRFRQQVIDRSISDHVLYAVVASAARFMEDRYSKSDFGALCAQLSWNLLSKHLHSDTDADLSFVQATTLLALFDFTGRHHSTYIMCFVGWKRS